MSVKNPAFPQPREARTLPGQDSVSPGGDGAGQGRREKNRRAPAGKLRLPLVAASGILVFLMTAGIAPGPDRNLLTGTALTDIILQGTVGEGERESGIFLAQTQAPGPAAGQVSSQAARRVLNQIAVLLERGDFDGAITRFSQIPPADAAMAQIRVLKASVYVSAGKNAEARALLQEILAVEPNNAEAIYVRAVIEQAEGRKADYRKSLERVVQISPNHLDALIRLGNYHLDSNSWSNAATWFTRALALDARNAEALLGRAEAYRRDPDAGRRPANLARAEQLLNQAIQIRPSWAAAYTERAQVHRAANNNAAARQDLLHAKQISPNDPWIACELGSVLFAQGQRAEALAEYTRATRLDPANFLAWVYVSGLRDDLGDLDGAEQAYNTLCRLKPDYYYAFEGAGFHRMRRKHWAEARDAFREAATRAPNEWSYAILAAACWMKAENLQAPRDFLNQALRRQTRDTLPWWVMRLFVEFSGDTDALSRIEREQSASLRARMTFFLALYYDVQGNTALANRCYLVVKEMDQKAIPEWRLNEWTCAERGLAVSGR